MRNIPLLLILVLVATCQPAYSQGSESGLLGVYPDYLHGRTTASGDIYDMGQLSAAHASLPLGSFARVANFDTGLMVDVKINDRKGKDDRIVTLSKAAAQRIGLAPAGAAPGSLLLISGIKTSAQQAPVSNTRALSAQSPSVPAAAAGVAAGGVITSNVPQSRGFKPFSNFGKKDPLYDAVNQPTANTVTQGQSAINQQVVNTQTQVNQKSGGLFKNGLFGNRSPRNAQVTSYSPGGNSAYAYPGTQPLSASSAIPSPDSVAPQATRTTRTVAPAQKAQSPGWQVQFGAFRKHENAVDMARGLGNTGIATRVVPITGSKLNAVLLNGGFASPNEAQRWIDTEAARRGWREKPVVVH